MEIVRRFFRELNENRKYQVVFFVVSMCVVLGIYLWVGGTIKEKKEHEFFISQDTSLVNRIEDVSIEGKTISISGWCFYKDIDNKDTIVQVFLKNVKDEADIIWLDVERNDRIDVKEYYKCNFDCGNVGFIAKGKTKKISEAEEYEIYIKFTFFEEYILEGNVQKWTRVRTVSTNQFLNKGKYVAVKNSENIGPTKTANVELIDKIFENGNLLVCRNDKDVYVYQYNNKLYWIVGENFAFDSDGATSIQFGVNTTRPDMLPEDKQSEGAEGENLLFVFEHNEIELGLLCPYRIAEYEIPNAYPIAWCLTGYYDNNSNEWDWKDYFTPDFRMYSER